MPNEQTDKRIAAPASVSGDGASGETSFQGFARPTSNTTYTPNQFFDVCLPHYPRGVVRLVAYMLRQTLGWCDEDGNPKNERLRVSYQEIVTRVGISRSMAKPTINQAIKGNFIRCVRKGRSNAAGKPGVSALYELKWDPSSEYVKDPAQFKGFFEAEGNKTDIPNQFFDFVIPREPLSVIKVVGSIIRFSIGFQARRGRRRQQVALSYQQIQNYSHIRNRTDLSNALQRALAHNYIMCVDHGYFDRSAGKDSKAATYKLRWADSPTPEAGSAADGSKIVPEKNEGTVRKSYREKDPQKRFENRTGNGSKIVPDEGFENRTDIKTKTGNEINKQQQDVPPEVSEEPTSAAADYTSIDREDVTPYRRLREVGFDHNAATELASVHSLEAIERQIRWMDYRRVERNWLGMLRKAIEQDWAEPVEKSESGNGASNTPAVVFARYFYAGYGGNPNEPTAEPSANDREVAERYVKRLLEAWPDESRVSKWGRKFGELVREKQAGNTKIVVSLSYALRAYGDEFFQIHEQTRRSAQKQEQLKAQQEREAQYTPRWLAYVEGMERKIRQERPEDYQAFKQAEESEREKIRTSPWQLRHDTALQHFDLREEYLKRFQEFFSDEVLGFWSWDKKFNRTHV